MENVFLTSLYEANYTLSTIKTTNEVIFATYTSKLFRKLLNKKNIVHYFH